MGKLSRIFNQESYSTIGAGYYGIILQSKYNEVIKLLKDYTECKSLKKEALAQEATYRLFQAYLPEVKVPKITYYSEDVISYKGTKYLCGIGMEYLEPPKDYTTQVHAVLGYQGSDIDSIWGMHTSEPVSASNPPRGFFASTYTLEDIWEDEGSSMTVELLAYQMGLAHRIMIDNGILPIDLEWVWSNGSLCCIDFGLCEFGKVEPNEFLNRPDSFGLKNDFYIPHEGNRGYDEFMKGYLLPPLI